MLAQLVDDHRLSDIPDGCMATSAARVWDRSLPPTGSSSEATAPLHPRDAGLCLHYRKPYDSCITSEMQGTVHRRSTLGHGGECT